MVSERQKREIQRRMRRIKDAKDDNKPKKVIERRTQELYQYLESEGIVTRFDD